MLSGRVEETIHGVVERVTFHNENNGYSVLKVKCHHELDLCTVVIHQTRVFAGATIKFYGHWSDHPTYGRQFSAFRSEEQRPASSAALEKYLGSGLIKGVGPKTARRIVSHFGKNTLAVFEESIEDLLQVPLIAEKKLRSIRNAWEEHRAIREVMIFLQTHGISTLFAVRIFKKYAQDAIRIIKNNPYRLADDFYGIGFFSADKVAGSLGISRDDPVRICAGIRHVLAASRENGHCYLTFEQIEKELAELLELDLKGQLDSYLLRMEDEKLLVKAVYPTGKDGESHNCYYSRTLYYDELKSANILRSLCVHIHVDIVRVEKWITAYSEKQAFRLSNEQVAAVKGLVSHGCGVLTGGPGCGKTTATRTLVSLFLAMGRKVILAAPTGRAAQRMEEVIGVEARTIHRILEFKNTSFTRNRDFPLECDVLIVDECSMLDISLTASLLEAVPVGSQLVLVGDSDQLPSVGAGNVLSDIISSGKVPVYNLHEIFRQASESRIIASAHSINSGKVPAISSPFKEPDLWRKECDCLFIDSSEATKEQLKIIRQVKERISLDKREGSFGLENLFFHDIAGDDQFENSAMFSKKYKHIDFGLLQTAEDSATELRAVLKKVHPWSSLYYGLTAGQVILRLYSEWIPRYFGSDAEIQVLSPMTRGSLGTVKLNQNLQSETNPASRGKAQVVLGERIFRVGDRVIHRRNNYDLGVYNGDIGIIDEVNTIDLTCSVKFLSDERIVHYQKDQIGELDLAYAVTIHKSQGSEFDCVIIPMVSQHFKMLFRNLIYTGLTRARKLAVFVGTRQALAMAVRNVDSDKRQTALNILLAGTDKT